MLPFYLLFCNSSIVPNSFNGNKKRSLGEKAALLGLPPIASLYRTSFRPHCCSMAIPSLGFKICFEGSPLYPPAAYKWLSISRSYEHKEWLKMPGLLCCFNNQGGGGEMEAPKSTTHSVSHALTDSQACSFFLLIIIEPKEHSLFIDASFLGSLTIVLFSDLINRLTNHIRIVYQTRIIGCLRLVDVDKGPPHMLGVPAWGNTDLVCCGLGRRRKNLHTHTPLHWASRRLQAVPF